MMKTYYRERNTLLQRSKDNKAPGRSGGRGGGVLNIAVDAVCEASEAALPESRSHIQVPSLSCNFCSVNVSKDEIKNCH